MTVNKKTLARELASKYSTDLFSAVIEYARMTDRIKLIAHKYVVIRDEMLSILPAYRHPTENELAEYMIFFSPDCANITGRIYQQPKFIAALEQWKIPGDLLSEIKKYVRESELQIIELAKCKQELIELKTKLADAKRTYDEHRDKRSDERNALVVQALGFSIGARPKRVDGKRVYIDYVWLVRKKGMTREKAVKEINKTYDLNSENAALKFLFAYRKSLLDRWKLEHPSMYPEIKKRLKGLIPRKHE